MGVYSRGTSDRDHRQQTKSARPAVFPGVSLSGRVLRTILTSRDYCIYNDRAD